MPHKGSTGLSGHVITPTMNFLKLAAGETCPSVEREQSLQTFCLDLQAGHL